MSWKKTAAVFMTALCISGGASAYNLQSIAKACLPPAFTYQDIPAQQESEVPQFHLSLSHGAAFRHASKKSKICLRLYCHCQAASCGGGYIETVLPGIPNRKRMEKPFPHEPRLSG